MGEEDEDIPPPFRILVRPPQFPSGKTATSIENMKAIAEWIFNRSKAMEIQSNFGEKQYKRIVHFIFVNNNLIEGDQWRDRLVRRDVQNMKIFSSKSDISDASKLKELITEGEYDHTTGKYIQIDYVLMCTHPTRLANIAGEKNGDSILRRLNIHHPDIAVMCWFDEIDKFVKILKDYIPKFQSFSNVMLMTGITATPYKRFWEIMHACGYNDIELLGQLPDPSDYRTLKDHTVLYSDKINEKKPVKNFKWILENPGKRMFSQTTEVDGKITKEKYKVPSCLSTNSGSILFVPGESARKSHDSIVKLALCSGKNALIINGKDKAFYRAASYKSELNLDKFEELHLGDYEKLDIAEYKKRQIKRQTAREHAGEKIPADEKFENMTTMDVAIKMYNDPAMKLKEGVDLVITGFYCVERGVTFNRPDFQFNYAILCPYHLKEGSMEIESIVQLAGRFHGNKEWVPKITVIAPKYIIEEVNKAIKNLIDFLVDCPKSIQYGDIFREEHGIPIHCTIQDKSLLDALVEIGNLITTTKKQKFQTMFKEGVKSGKILLNNPNHEEKKRITFNFEDYQIGTKRICSNAEKQKNYRFSQFYDNHTLRIPYGQTAKPGEFQIDISTIPISINKDTTLPSGTCFISFAYKNAD